MIGPDRFINSPDSIDNGKGQRISDLTAQDVAEIMASEPDKNSFAIAAKKIGVKAVKSEEEK